ncbi:MAG: hypothetical protein V4580_14185 [Bacteroidota bacterium]
MLTQVVYKTEAIPSFEGGGRRPEDVVYSTFKLSIIFFACHAKK